MEIPPELDRVFRELAAKGIRPAPDYWDYTLCNCTIHILTKVETHCAYCIQCGIYQE